MTASKKIIISGAGLAGLLLAQVLKQRGIDFVILDRDINVQFRENAGWAITLHWALGNFLSLLPKHLADQIYDAQVLPKFNEKDTGKFIYINAGTGEPVVSIPPSKRLRVRREQIRRILLQGIDVQWDCKVEKIDRSNNEVSVICANGRKFTGDVLVGCEGANSITRRLICPENGQLYQLPVRFCGAKVRMTKEETELIAKAFDPLLFQGTVPGSNTFFWFSMLSTPEYTKDPDVYYAQVNLSWNTPQGESFATKQDMANAMLSHCEGLSPKLKWLVERAVEDPESLMEIKLCDWPVAEWPYQDQILLAGDAAHAMTMYRGEAGNHGITDIFDLTKEIDSFLLGAKTWEKAAKDYCDSVKSRASPAVLLSRQACLDAHDFSKIRPDTDLPLLSMRKNTK